MPIVRIENYPDLIAPNGVALPRPPDMKAWRRKLADELAVAFVRAEIAGTKSPDQVHVLLGNTGLRPMDKTLIITVEAIFDGPEPTNDDGRSERKHEMRQRLANLLAEAALKKLPTGWRVWILANTSTQERESHGYFGPLE